MRKRIGNKKCDLYENIHIHLKNNRYTFFYFVNEMQIEYIIKEILKYGEFKRKQKKQLRTMDVQYNLSFDINKKTQKKL